MSKHASPNWQRTVSLIKQEYPSLHLLYSSADGWARVTMRQTSIKISLSKSIETIRTEINNMIDKNTVVLSRSTTSTTDQAPSLIPSFPQNLES